MCIYTYTYIKKIIIYIDRYYYHHEVPGLGLGAQQPEVAGPEVDPGGPPHTYICIYMYICIYIYTYLHIHIYKYTYIDIHNYSNVDIYIYIYI